MYKYLEILSILLILLFGSCKKGKNILISDMGYKKLQITTSKTTYYWNQSEEDRIIAIQGELINESTITYYSRVGDYFGDSELLFFSENSAGRLETYDTLKKEWINSGLLGLLIEGIDKQNNTGNRPSRSISFRVAKLYYGIIGRYDNEENDFTIYDSDFLYKLFR
ncbi:MAG: hypothetical protein P8Y99_01815 [Calditrichaceae bacterium]